MLAETVKIVWQMDLVEFVKVGVSLAMGMAMMSVAAGIYLLVRFERQNKRLKALESKNEPKKETS